MRCNVAVECTRDNIEDAGRAGHDSSFEHYFHADVAGWEHSWCYWQERLAQAVPSKNSKGLVTHLGAVLDAPYAM